MREGSKKVNEAELSKKEVEVLQMKIKSVAKKKMKKFVELIRTLINQ